MDAKLNQSDLISLLAKESNISVAKAELFTKSFFDLVIEGLEQDGIVKINGLGTFRITDVASRGSVNVNTGEKIEIKGHRKLTFVPADALKEQVNQPFAMFEPVEVDDTYQPEPSDDIESEESAEPVENANVAAETVENPMEIQTGVEEVAVVAETPVEETALPETAKEPAAEVVENNVVVEAAPAVEEEKKEETVAHVVAEPVVIQERPAEPVVVQVPKKRQPEQKPAPVKKKWNKWLNTFSVFIGVVVGMCVIRMMDRNHTDDNTTDRLVTDNTTTAAEVKNEVVASKVEIVDSVTPTITDENVMPATEQSAEDVQEEIADYIYVFEVVDELEAMKLKDITVADTLLYVADGEICRHTVAPDETLTKIAKLYFFDKKLWPYIVKYNNISKPDDLCRGMLISIPRLMPRR